MLTKITLDGVMGKRFGKHWELNIARPKDALKLINANKPGVFQWIRENLGKFKHYKVVCEYHDGTKEIMDTDAYVATERIPKSIRFTPMVEGAGGKGQSIGQMVLGAIMVVVGVLITIGTFGAGTPGGAALIVGGIGMMVGGVISLLTPTPTLDEGSGTENKYFDGPTNTSRQGVPVPLVYGEILTGSHPVAIDLSLDETWKPTNA